MGDANRVVAKSSLEWALCSLIISAVDDSADIARNFVDEIGGDVYGWFSFW